MNNSRAVGQQLFLPLSEGKVPSGRMGFWWFRTETSSWTSANHQTPSVVPTSPPPRGGEIAAAALLEPEFISSGVERSCHLARLFHRSLHCAAAIATAPVEMTGCSVIHKVLKRLPCIRSGHGVPPPRWFTWLRCLRAPSRASISQSRGGGTPCPMSLRFG